MQKQRPLDSPSLIMMQVRVVQLLLAIKLESRAHCCSITTVPLRLMCFTICFWEKKWSILLRHDVPQSVLTNAAPLSPTTSHCAWLSMCAQECASAHVPCCDWCVFAHASSELHDRRSVIASSDPPAVRNATLVRMDFKAVCILIQQTTWVVWMCLWKESVCFSCIRVLILREHSVCSLTLTEIHFFLWTYFFSVP